MAFTALVPHNKAMPSQWTATDPQRLDSFLADQSPQLSRSRIQKMIKMGWVEVNGEGVCKPAHRLKEGDIVFQLDGVETFPDEASIAPVDLHLPVLIMPAGYVTQILQCILQSVYGLQIGDQRDHLFLALLA